MPLREMIAAFTALSNEEAHFVCDLLVRARIRGRVKEAYLYGPDSQPEVWIEHVDLPRAEPVLQEYLRHGDDWRMAKWQSAAMRYQETEAVANEWYAAEQRSAVRTDTRAEHETIEVTCPECGNRSRFPAALRGRVEDCQHCNALVDVGNDADFEVPADCSNEEQDAD